MKLIVVAGNAFIELFEHDMPMVLTKNQLIDYSDVVSKRLGQFIDISEAGFSDLKLNYDKIISFSNEGFILPAKNVTAVDLEARFRSNISTEELAAFTSLKARKVLGIGEYKYPKKAKK